MLCIPKRHVAVTNYNASIALHCKPYIPKEVRIMIGLQMDYPYAMQCIGLKEVRSRGVLQWIYVKARQ